MNTYIVIITLSIVLLLSFSVWIYFLFKKKLASVTEELTFLKKEKDYYPEAMMTFSSDYRVTFANQTAREMFSLNDKNQIDNSSDVKLKLGKEFPKDFVTCIKTINLVNYESFKIDDTSLIMNGKKKKVHLYLAQSAWNHDKMITCVIDMNTENSQKHIKNNEQNKRTSIDILTNLPNQFTALSDINSLIIESKKNSESFSLLLLGIDHFIDIQTTLGLSYTNQILRTMSQFFIQYEDEMISVYRMDTDKFLLLVKSTNEDTSIAAIARDMIISVGNVYRDNNNIRLTSSIGIVQYPKDGENASKLIDNSYIALAKAQEQGTSNIKLLDLNHDATYIDESKMHEEIRAGLNKNEFLLHYQPMFDLAGERIIGAEALIRWQHPEHGLLTADRFLDVAEKTGLIVDLGEYVFNEAIQERQRCNTGYTKDFQITINLSLKEIQVDKLIPKLETLFDKYNVEKNAINLDISETAVMEYIDKTAHDLKLLNEFGLSLSIDHFGVGYSSFKYLSMLPLNMIKIDRSLIFDLTLNLEHQTTVRAIINFAHTLDYKVVAEGVETKEQATILKTLNCDYSQGYLYSRPLPAAAFEELLN